MSLTETLRAGAPQAFGALYDEHARAVYAYCYVMVGDEAGDALRDVFVQIARHPDAAPGDDAELAVWLHSLARAECVRRGAFLRGVVATTSTAPLRRALALLSPEYREILALSNALDPAETARVLGVASDTAEPLVREAQWRLEQAAASVNGQETRDSAALASLSGEALHRLVTLGYEPPAGLREQVLSSCAAARRARGGAAVFGADGTPLPLDAFSAQADDATHQFSKISPDESATAPLQQIDATSVDARPDQSGPGDSRPADPPPAEPTPPEPVFSEPVFSEPAFTEAGFAEAASVALESVGAGPDEGWNASTGEQPPPGRGTHAKRREPVLRRRIIPVVGVVACVAAATGVALAWPGSNDANRTSAIVHQSAHPSRPVQPAPSADQTSSPPQEAGADPDGSPAPTGTAAPTESASPSSSASAATPTATASPSSSPSVDDSDSASPTSSPSTDDSATPTPKPSRSPKPHRTPRPHRTPSAEPTWPAEPTHSARPTTRPGRSSNRPKPHHTAAPDGMPGDGHGTTGRRDPYQACDETSQCARPHPWRPDGGDAGRPGGPAAPDGRRDPQR